ncbi:hypothetical protein B9Z55_025659 [Caenorhabditis nigoni]|nr:hypothetical protein B9Z55_025659 [Caenorhabditis nigoni]
MLLLHLVIFTLFVTTTALIDCSEEDTCFGEPYDCDPETQCNSLFHFDTAGNLHLYLRNFTDSNGYAAFATQTHPDEIIEYFICLPHQGQRLRALAELGGIVLVTDQNLTGVVELLGENYFRCIFNVSELPKQFQNEQIFFVSKGTFDETLVIYDGEQLFNLDRFENSDEYLEDNDVLPVAYQISSKIHHRSMEDVLSSDDKNTMSDAINNLPKSSAKSKDDVELEKIARSSRHIRARHTRRNEDEDVEEEDNEERHQIHHKHHHAHKHDNEESSDSEDYDTSKSKKGRRHHNEESEPRRKHSKKSVIEKEEYDNQEYDDTDNADASNNINYSFACVIIAGLLRYRF